MECHILENHLFKFTECLLSFKLDSIENINRLVALLGELMGATCALYNRLDNDTLCSIGKWNLPQDCKLEDRAKGHICYDVIQNAKDDVIVIHNLQETCYFYTDSNVKKYNLRTYIGRAIKFVDRYVGALCVVYQKDYYPSLEEERLMELIASAIAIEEERKRVKEEIKKEEHEKVDSLNKELFRTNMKLRRLVIKDPLTGFYSHRYFKEIMESEFYRAKRYHRSLSLIFIDIDYFRSVNDAYGYKFGDLVLKQFAHKLKKSVKRHDCAVRFGDEEFVIILPGNNKQGALELGQRIANSIRTFTFGDGNNLVKLRLSIAVVSYPEDGIFRSSDFIVTAERILNRAKEHGGDRVCSISDMQNDDFSDKIKGIKHLKQKLLKLTKKANQSSVESIFAFAKTIELKDHYTGNHVERTVYYANEIAKRLGLPAEDIKLIEQASMLHDLGKIGISEKILLKKSPLSAREFKKIKEHPKIGVDIIRPIQSFHNLLPLILYHHERWDGKGYPFGLKGNEIPIGARIIAIADVYEALISDRPYRKALSKREALKIIKENSGTQFDPKIAKVLVEVLKKNKA